MTQTPQSFKNMSKQIGTFKVNSGRFAVSSDIEKEAILLGRNAANTNKSTVGAVNCLGEYLSEKRFARSRSHIRC